MTDYEVFPHAPVEEAIITIRISDTGDLAAHLDAFRAAVEHDYPVAEEIESRDGATAKDKAAHAEGHGIRLLSADRQRAVQLTADTFSYHLLRPYTHWADFAARARSAWDALTAGQERWPVSQVRLRYVNAFQLPIPFEDWGEFLAIHPNLPPAVDTGLASFWMTLDLADRSVPGRAIVTQTTLPLKNQQIPCVFDIDTHSLRLFSATTSADEIWGELGRLRDYKNRLFFDGLTERAKELFR